MVLAASTISLGALYVIYSFDFVKHMPWMKLFHFLEGTHGITPREMGIMDVELVKEMLARYKCLTHLINIAFATMVPLIISFAIFEIYKATRDINELTY